MKQNHTNMSKSRKTRSSSKSNAATLFNRYVWLVDTIYRAGRITFEEINERWQRSSLNETGEELPLKTFHNHKNAIQQMFDINIECNRKGGYFYYIEHAEDMERGGVRTWLLNTFAVNHLINESHHLKRRILFEEIPSGQRFLTQIIEAMRDNRTLEMSYQSFWNDTPRTFEVAPYCVKVFRQRWYVVACSTSDDRLRIYALDRIRELRTSEHLFILPDDFDPQAYFANSFGIAVDESYKPEQVRVLVSHAAAAHLAAGDRNYERFFRIRILPATDARFPAGAADACRQHRLPDRGSATAVAACGNEANRSQSGGGP